MTNKTAKPLFITMDDRDNVAIVVNDGGLPAGTMFSSGLTLVEKIPQAHKVALVNISKGEAVKRYNVTIGIALKDIPAGSWVHERLLEMPDAQGLEDLPIATVKPIPLPALDGYTFEGYRNADGSVGTRNILAITTTVQCVAGVVDFAVQRIKQELLPMYPNVDDVVGLEDSATHKPGPEPVQVALANLGATPDDACYVGDAPFDIAAGNAAGVTTIGVPIGMGVIIFTIVITGIYVRRANGEYDRLTREILEDVAK
jgi:hypothetical protein